jgi:hypothetical protein
MYESPVTITLDRKDDFIVRASRSRRSGKGWYHDIQILPRKTDDLLVACLQCACG